MLIDLKKLKSESDIRANAENFNGFNIELTDEIIAKLTKGFMTFLFNKYHLIPKNFVISIGYDNRRTSKHIKDAVIETLKAYGSTIYDCGLCCTSAMFKSITGYPKAMAAIMITAGHLPQYKNGFKFFTSLGSLENEEIDELLNYISENKLIEPDFSKQSKIDEIEFIKIYSRYLVNLVLSKTKQTLPFKNLKLVLNVSGGVGGFFADEILNVLGGKVFCVNDSAENTSDDILKNTIDNLISNDENSHENTLKNTIDAVVSNKADLGIIFEGDCGRVRLINSDGAEIKKSRLIALIAKILLDEKTQYNETYIVTDNAVSDSLTAFIKKCGGIHYKFKCGYKNVINQAIKLNVEGKYCPLAIETSGHAAFIEDYFADDAVYLTVKLLIKLKLLKEQNLTFFDFIKDYNGPKEDDTLRIGFKNKSKADKILKDFEDYCKTSSAFKLDENNREGVRATYKSTLDFFLFRKSLHENSFVLDMQSDTAGSNKKMAKNIFDFLKAYPELDLSALEACK